MYIDDYSFGKIVIDGKSYFKDVIIFPDFVFSPWIREEGHLLLKKDLKKIAEKRPETLIIGTGFSGLMKVPEETLIFLKEKEINPIIFKTENACREFNRLTKNEKSVTGAFHLTC